MVSMDISRIKLLASKYYNKLVDETTSPQEMGYIVFLIHLNLFMMNSNQSVEDFMNDYKKDFIEWTRESVKQ